MTRCLVGVLIAGCAGGSTPASLSSSSSPAGTPNGFQCPEGMVYTVEAPGTGTSRTLPETEVHTCRDPAGNQMGPQLERWPAGGVAAEGAWAAGARDGAWTTWYPDGAFHSRSTWHGGVQDGARWEIAGDGRIVEIDMMGGAAGGLRSLPLGTPMPEWDGGARVEGTRYRTHPGSGDSLAP